MNKDFYDRLPSMVCVMLDDYIKEYKSKSWFKQAWEEYRQHVLNTYWENVKMPGFVFNKYLNKNEEVRDVKDKR